MHTFNKKLAVISTIVAIFIYSTYMVIRLYLLPNYFNISVETNHYFLLDFIWSNSLTVIVNVTLFLVIYNVIKLIYKKIK